MKKKITVIGTGYVGLVSAVGLAGIGHEVTAVDNNKTRIKDLKKGWVPFYEPGLKKKMKDALRAGRIHFTSESDLAVQSGEIIFIAVGTPSAAGGKADLSQINAVVDVIIENLESSKIIVIKSTVPPGTTDAIRERMSAELEYTDSDVVFCPEFLREGTAVHDFFHPDRIVIGSDSKQAARIVENVFYPAISRDIPVLNCSPVSAELIKYGSNVMLASRIAVINELAELSEAVGGDICQAAAGIGLDKRIGKDFLKAGPGFGGSCFGKDVAGIIKAGEYHGVNMQLVSTILTTNDSQKMRPARRLETELGSLKGRKVAVLGLAFKADTDDVRGSAAFDVIDYLIENGAQVKAHDPEAEYRFIIEYKKKGYSCCEKKEDALSKADALIILTDWEEYKELEPEKLSQMMRGNTIVDSRNILDHELFSQYGFTCMGTGRRTVSSSVKNRGRNDLLNAAIVSV